VTKNCDHDREKGDRSRRLVNQLLPSGLFIACIDLYRARGQPAGRRPGIVLRFGLCSSAEEREAKLAGRGSSFKGAGQYYLHDKQAETSERVAWTETVNLRTANPDRAIRVMAATAMDRDALKLAAGIKAGGRSSDKVVQTYSLAWHPEQKPKTVVVQEALQSLLDANGQARRDEVLTAAQAKNPAITKFDLSNGLRIFVKDAKVRVSPDDSGVLLPAA